MGLSDWFSRKSKPASAAQRPHSAPNSVPFAPTAPAAPDRRQAGSAPAHPVASQRKTDNAQLREQLRLDALARRENLYAAIRKAMARVNIAVSNYKFKVLALDQSGRQYLVMIEVGANIGKTPAQMTDIEQVIAHTAKTELDIVVTGVYWRLSQELNQATNLARRPQVEAPPPFANTVADPHEVVEPGPAAAMPQVPVPVASLAQAPAKAAPTPEASPSEHAGVGAGGRYEPLQSEEMLAFKRALAATGTAPQPAGPRPAPRSYSPLATGYEDTQVVSPETRPPGLGATQYGDL